MGSKVNDLETFSSGGIPVDGPRSKIN